MHKNWVQNVDRLCLFVVLKCVRLFTKHTSYPYVYSVVTRNMCLIKQFIHCVITAIYTPKIRYFNPLYGSLYTQSTPLTITTELNN